MERRLRFRKMALFVAVALSFGLGVSSLAAALWNRSSDGSGFHLFKRTAKAPAAAPQAAAAAAPAPVPPPPPVAAEPQASLAQLRVLSERMAQNHQPALLWRFELDQAQILFRLAAYSKGEECDNYLRLAVESVYYAALQSPEEQRTAYQWLLVLPEQISRAFPGNAVAFHAARLEIQADYERELAKSGGQGGRAREHYCERLIQFAQVLPQAPDAPKAVLEAAELRETMKKPEEARWSYQYLAEHFPTDALAHQARVGLRRLTLEGQPVRLDLPLLFSPADGQEHLFNWDEFRGDLVVVYFWSSTCQHAAEDFQALRRLTDQYEDRGLEVVYVNVDANPEAGKKFLETRMTNGVHLYQKGGLTGEVAERYGLDTVPHVLLLGRNGVVLRSGVEVHQVEREVFYQLARGN